MVARGQKYTSVSGGRPRDRRRRSLWGTVASGACRLGAEGRPRLFRWRKRGTGLGTAVRQTEEPRREEHCATQQIVESGVDTVVEPDDSQRGVVSRASARDGELVQCGDGRLGVDARWVVGKGGHRALVCSQRGETVYPITVNACEQHAASGGNKLSAEGVRHRTVERVGSSRRQRGVLRKSASEWPAVVGCGVAARRLPPGRVYLACRTTHVALERKRTVGDSIEATA
eukprot:6209499-Pleurochrysis_carterae.AAC.2